MKGMLHIATRYTDPLYRISEQNADNNQRRLTSIRRTTNQAYRIEENERNDSIIDGNNGQHIWMPLMDGINLMGILMDGINGRH